MKPALLFYCQHSVGLGHLMRSYALCEALAERFRVVLLAGGELPEGIEPPRGRRDRRAAAAGRASGGASAAATRATRPSARGRSARSASGRRSHDAQPQRRARRAVPVRAREVRPRARPAARAGARSWAPSPPAACATSSSARAPTSASTTTAPPRSPTRTWTPILVHCDPRFARLEETFKPRTPLTRPRPLHGLRHPQRRTRTHDRGEHIVVSAGGGRVGRPLLEEAMEASDGRPMRAIAGPLMPDERLRARCKRSRPPNVELLRSRPRPRRTS